MGVGDLPLRKDHSKNGDFDLGQHSPLTTLSTTHVGGPISRSRIGVQYGVITIFEFLQFLSESVGFQGESASLLRDTIYHPSTLPPSSHSCISFLPPNHSIPDVCVESPVVHSLSTGLAPVSVICDPEEEVDDSTAGSPEGSLGVAAPTGEFFENEG